MIVLDAGVMIAHLDANDAHHDRAGQLMLEMVDEPLAASPLTLVEVLVGPTRACIVAAAQAALADLEVRTVPLEDDAPTRLAMLRATTRLRLLDCCVLLATETSHAALATFDERLGGAAEQLGLAVRR